MEHEYLVVGTQPVGIPGTKEYAQPDTTFYADPNASTVKFAVEIGAIKETGKKRGSAPVAAKKAASKKKGGKKREPFTTDAADAPKSEV